MSNTTFPMVAAARPRTLSPLALPCVDSAAVATAGGTPMSWVDVRGGYALAAQRTTGFEHRNSTINSDATVKQGRPPRGEPR